MHHQSCIALLLIGFFSGLNIKKIVIKEITKFQKKFYRNGIT